MPEFYMTFARKINKIPEFYMIYARKKNNKMAEFYTIFARKNSFCPNLGGGYSCPSYPPSPTPMVLQKTQIWRRTFQRSKAHAKRYVELCYPD